MFVINGRELNLDMRRLSTLLKGEEVISFSSNKKKKTLTLSVKTENYSLSKILPCSSVTQSVEFGLIKDVAVKTFNQASDIQIEMLDSELKFKYLKSTYQGRLTTVDYVPPAESEGKSSVEIPPSLYSILFRQLPKLSLKPTHATVEDLLILVRGTQDGFNAVITDDFHTALMTYPTKDSFDFQIDIPASYGSLVSALIGDKESFSCITTDSSLSVNSDSVSLVLPHSASHLADPDLIIKTFNEYKEKFSFNLQGDDLKTIFKNFQAIFEEETFELSIVIEEKLLRFKAKSQLGSLSETIKISKGSKKRVVLNVDRSILDIVQRLQGEVTLAIDPSSNQIIWRISSEKYMLSYANLLLQETDTKSEEL